MFSVSGLMGITTDHLGEISLDISSGVGPPSEEYSRVRGLPNIISQRFEKLPQALRQAFV